MNEKALDYGTLTKEQFDAEIEKGIADIKAGRVYSADEVKKEMKELMKKSFILFFKNPILFPYYLKIIQLGANLSQ